MGDNELRSKYFVESRESIEYKEKAVINLTEFAEKESKEIRQLKGVTNSVGHVGLWMDSKVAEKDKGLFNFISNKVSDKKEILDEIEKYLSFYDSISDLKDIKSCYDDESIDNAYEKLEKLYEDLMSLTEEAVIEKDSTDSKTIYDLKKKILDKKSLIEKKLEKVELSITDKKLNSLNNKFADVLTLSEISQFQIDCLTQENEEREKSYIEALSLLEKLMEAKESRKNDNTDLHLLQYSFKKSSESLNISIASTSLEADVKSVIKEVKNCESNTDLNLLKNSFHKSSENSCVEIKTEPNEGLSKSMNELHSDDDSDIEIVEIVNNDE